MRTILSLVLFLVLTGYATAQTGQSMVFKHSLSSGGGPVALRIYLSEPCTYAPALAHIAPRYREMFRRSVLTWQGKDFEACWVEYDGRALSVDEDGAWFNQRQGGVPLTQFQDDAV